MIMNSTGDDLIYVYFIHMNSRSILMNIYRIDIDIGLIEINAHCI